MVFGILAPFMTDNLNYKEHWDCKLLWL